MDYQVALSSHPGKFGFYFAAGFVLGLVATLLIPIAIIGTFLRPIPQRFGRFVELLTILLAVASAICIFAYTREIWIAYHGANRYELYTFLHFRFGNGYGWFYALSFLYLLLPQLFWWPRMRRSLLVILLVAIGVSTETWYEQAVVFITQHQQDYLPQSWRK